MAFQELMLEHLAEEDEMVPDMRRSFTQQEERQVLAWHAQHATRPFCAAISMRSARAKLAMSGQHTVRQRMCSPMTRRRRAAMSLSSLLTSHICRDPIERLQLVSADSVSRIDRP